MATIERRLHFPEALLGVIGRYAEAIMRNDIEAGAKLVTMEAPAQASQKTTMEHAAGRGPWSSFELIARARLGFQYIAKVRLHGANGDLTLQCRWREEQGAWRIAEIADVGSRSPWLKPEPLPSGRGDANG
jgi:hypothetical protein